MEDPTLDDNLRQQIEEALEQAGAEPVKPKMSDMTTKWCSYWAQCYQQYAQASLAQGGVPVPQILLVPPAISDICMAPGCENEGEFLTMTTIGVAVRALFCCDDHRFHLVPGMAWREEYL